VRVIAGRLRGRRLVAPSGAATRPTSDRVKEALFSILGDVNGSNVLDLFAGTGALGIEALSRGARACTFVEVAPAALAALRQNIGTLGIQHEAAVLPMRVERALAARPWAPEAFDLILLDPPYAETRGAQFSRALEKALAGGLTASLAADGRVVLEHASAEGPPAISKLSVSSTRTYGDTSLTFYV
jgi:16S rRNA (guanine966-N2)-methyltransferase